MKQYLYSLKKLSRTPFFLLLVVLFLGIANIVAVITSTQRTTLVSRGQTGGACGTITVSNITQLVNAISTANGNSSCGTTIVLADGTYTLSDRLQVTAPNLTVKSQSGDRTKVILQGDGMSEGAVVKEIFFVNASNFTVQDITMQRVGWHIIQVASENNADNITVRNCAFRDAYQQLFKVTYVDTNMGVGSDNGIVKNSLFEYSAGIGPQYYIGGVDAHNAKNWVVRGNTFKNIIGPSGSVAEFAIHFWSSSADTLVEKNLILIRIAA